MEPIYLVFHESSMYSSPANSFLGSFRSLEEARNIRRPSHTKLDDRLIICLLEDNDMSEVCSCDLEDPWSNTFGDWR